MDRNFFLALALAMLVAVGYQSIFVVPQKAKELKAAQLAAAKEDVTKETSTKIDQSIQTIPAKISTNPSFKETISVLKTPNIEAQFTNVGGALHNIDFGPKKKSFLVEDIFTIKGFEQANYVLVNKTDSSLTYAFINSEIKILKEYKIADSNSLKVKIEITNRKSDSRLEDVKIITLNVNGSSIDPKDNRNTMLDEISILEGKKVIRIGNAFKFNTKQNKVVAEQVGFVAFRDHYHAFIVKPEFDTKSYENEMVSEKQLATLITPKNQQLAAGTTSSYDFSVVVGNQDINWLKTYNKGIEKVVAFSGFWPIDFFAKAVYYTIPVLHSICRSWGLSIILISLLIYGITYPLTMKSMSSMRKMQLLQPKIAALQAKYKKDPQKLNAEMIEIYKKEGVNPLGGCLPFLLQMPVFMALYQILWRAYYFQGESFLWMKDLALPDRLFHLPFEIPFLGSDFNILPILMAIVMFVQQSISSKNIVVTDEQQVMQQKMMKYIFPFFIGFIFYKFASGLSLYFTVFYALSAWTQWKVANTPAAKTK